MVRLYRHGLSGLLALIAGVTWRQKNESRVYNIATDAKRSPGSCIKPIASYAPALDQDLMTWSTLFTDEPITIKVKGKDKKWPVNYSETGDSANWSYQQLTTVEMLTRSLNTLPATAHQKNDTCLFL